VLARRSSSTKLLYIGPSYYYDGWLFSGGPTIWICNQPARLAIRLWVGRMSTSESSSVMGTPCDTLASYRVSQHKLVSGWDIAIIAALWVRESWERLYITVAYSAEMYHIYFWIKFSQICDGLCLVIKSCYWIKARATRSTLGITQIMKVAR